MDSGTATQLLTALRGCGLYPAEQVAAAHRALTAGDKTDAAVAERLNAAGVLTSYQYRKIKAGRADEVLFGLYLLLDKVGEGGMGKVYRAVHTGSRRMAALKVVRPQLMANPTVRKRYAREAKAAASLDHPNIVTLFDTDEVDGRYFLAMEYVDGIDLSRLMKAFGNPPTSGLPNYQEACEYVRQAALGLAHAHARGLIHRDVKPSNILVSGERALPGTPGRTVVKVLDMGLVRSIMESDDNTGTELTRDGTVVGTPDYMAPEQAKNSSTVDPRADLYALGCTLYFLLRGRPPFPDGSPIDKLLRHQLDPPPDLRAGRPDVPVGVAAVVEKLMKKTPAERYQSAAEVAAALLPYTPAGEAHRAAAGEPPADNPFAFSFAPEPAAGGPQAGPAPAAPPGGVRLRIAQPGQASGPRPAPPPRPSTKPSAPVRPAARVPTPTTMPRAGAVTQFGEPADRGAGAARHPVGDRQAGRDQGVHPGPAVGPDLRTGLQPAHPDQPAAAAACPPPVEPPAGVGDRHRGRGGGGRCCWWCCCSSPAVGERRVGRRLRRGLLPRSLRRVRCRVR
ncbi:MAG: protein kinase [Gemmataceae bacterium]